MDPARLEHLARAATNRWRGDRDLDDLRQEARIAVWQAGDDTPDRLAVVIARRRCIDWLRRRDGQRKSPRPPVNLVAVTPDERCRWDTPDPAVELGLTGRAAVVATMVAEGHTRRQAAAAIGRDPAVVTRILADLAQTI